WFWLVLLVCFFMIRALFTSTPEAVEGVAEPEIQVLSPETQQDVVREVMNVGLATQEAGVQVFHGRLREPAESAFDKLKQMSPEDTLPLTQEDERHGAVIMLVPEPARKQTQERPWINALRFGATVLTTAWAGAAQQGVDLLHNPEKFAVGLPYALGLLAMLGM